jgi:cytochrome c peroxidase
MSLYLRAMPLVCLAFASACAESEVSTARSSLSLEDRIAACGNDPRVIAEVVSLDTCVGGDLFFRETFDGNGRTCATCHPVDNNFTIEPDFIATLPSGDPLFVAESNQDLAELEKPPQMRAFGLILENVDGLESPTQKFLLRTVPHNLSMGVSVARPPDAPPGSPAERTGWSGDGAPNAGALRDFLTGAIIQHYTKSLARTPGQDFRLAIAGELDRIDHFMRQLGRTSELNLATVVMSDLRAELGRLLFLVNCNRCHGNAGANAGLILGGNRNFDTGVERVRNSALAGFSRDSGFGQAPDSMGGFGDGTFNTPPLIEAADTGPFFHTATSVSGAPAHNTPTATTIEQAIAFYTTFAFNTSPGGVPPILLTAPQIDDIGRFLRAINAAFNAQLANKRLGAARTLADRFVNEHLAMQREMLRLADVEVKDAIEVLSGQPQLNTHSVELLREAHRLIEDARETSSATGRSMLSQQAHQVLTQAYTRLGTNLTLQIGDGTVMF